MTRLNNVMLVNSMQSKKENKIYITNTKTNKLGQSWTQRTKTHSCGDKIIMMSKWLNWFYSWDQNPLNVYEELKLGLVHTTSTCAKIKTSYKTCTTVSSWCSTPTSKWTWSRSPCLFVTSSKQEETKKKQKQKT